MNRINNKSDHNEMNILSLREVVKKAISETQLLLFSRPSPNSAISNQFKVHFKLALTVPLFNYFHFCSHVHNRPISLHSASSRLKNYTFRKDDSLCIVIFGLKQKTAKKNRRDLYANICFLIDQKSIFKTT